MSSNVPALSTPTALLTLCRHTIIRHDADIFCSVFGRWHGGPGVDRATPYFPNANASPSPSTYRPRTLHPRPVCSAERAAALRLRRFSSTAIFRPQEDLSALANESVGEFPCRQSVKNLLLILLILLILARCQFPPQRKKSSSFCSATGRSALLMQYSREVCASEILEIVTFTAVPDTNIMMRV